MEVLKKTLDEMNVTFSSNEFSKQAVKNGLNKELINNGIIAFFLHKNAKQMETKRMWEKKINKNIIDNNINNEIQKAIKLLKSNNYKIFKPINEYVEI